MSNAANLAKADRYIAKINSLEIPGSRKQIDAMRAEFNGKVLEANRSGDWSAVEAEYAWAEFK